MYRNIETGFWTDSKIEQVGCSEKLLMLYLLTAPHGNLAGCYEVTFRRIELETGLSQEQIADAIDNLISFEIIAYSKETNEVLLINWWKHNWSKSPKAKAAVEKQISQVNDIALKKRLASDFERHYGIPYTYPIDTVSIPYAYHINNEMTCENDTVSIPYPYPIDTHTISVSVSDTTSKKDLLVRDSNSVLEIVEYLNTAVSTSYKPSSKKTASLINARLNEGFTVDDFKAVIDTKASDWLGDSKMSRYLRPETLFGTKFEGYLQEAKAVRRDDERFAKYA